MGIDKLIETPPYALDKNQKSQALLQYLIDLTNRLMKILCISFELNAFVMNESGVHR